MHNILIALGAALACAAAAVLLGEDVQQTSAPVVIPTDQETLVAVGNAVTTPNPNGKAVVRAWVEMTIGAGTTGITVSLYAGAVIGGRLVGQATADDTTFSDGSDSGFQIERVDPFNNVSGVQYCLSVQQAGATGNGTVLTALIDTKVLSG